MGDRICIRLTDGRKTTPLFYGHWCGLRAVEVMNEVLTGENNDIHNAMCNFIVKVTDGITHPYSYYLYNDTEGNSTMADWDNYCWTFDTSTGFWTTTYPELAGKKMTPEEADRYAGSHRAYM